VETIKTEVGAKTMGLDTKTHKLFLDTADFSPAPAPTAAHPIHGERQSTERSHVGLRTVTDRLVRSHYAQKTAAQ